MKCTQPINPWRNTSSPNDSNILSAIDQRLEQWENERKEIEEKYGIDENILQSFSFSDKIPKFPPSLTQTIPKQKKWKYEKLSKIDEIITVKEIALPYKTPDMLVDSLKYEPNIYDWHDKETFEPTFASLNGNKPKPENPSTYDIIDYVNDNNNRDYFNNIFH